MKKYIYIVALVLLMGSCANLGQGPQGGPRDTIPPLVVKEIPVNGVLMYHGKKIEISFNEYIQLDDVQKNVLISPPQQQPPEVKAVGKTLSIAFQEELRDSTTYTINFGSAICDYNEKVPLEGYVFAFSTGDHIDSLAVSGRVCDAATLNPVASVLVGLHRNVEDSAFSSMPFARITRTDAEGHFTIHNIQPGTYRIYALNDISRDYLYQPGEGLAFYDSLITPSFEVEIHSDTLWRDSITIDAITGDTLIEHLVDSVEHHSVTHFYPDSLLLWYFEEAKQRHYLQGVHREEQHAFTLIFSAPQDSLPVIRALRSSEVDSLNNDSAWVDFLDYSMLQVSKHLDTITYWLLDSVAIAMDSIYMQIQYKVTDSVYNLIPQTDTILAVYRHPRLSDKAREALEKKKLERKLELTTNASSSFDIFDTIRIVSAIPLDSVHDTLIHLSQKVDTILQPIPFSVQRQDSMAMTLLLVANLQPEMSYQLQIDSAACRDMYGACNDEIKKTIKLKSKNDYSSLRVKMTNYDERARIQLLNEKEVVIREFAVTPEGVLFEYLKPSSFFLRLYIDENEDGQWTTGDWLLKRQAESIYYYPKKLKLRANWDFEEQFDHLAVPQIDSKPKALREKSDKKNNRR
jgi:hypothetical protein